MAAPLKNAEPTRVLILTKYFPPYHDMLGAMVRMLKLAEYLKENGCEVHVLTCAGSDHGYLGYEATLRELKVHYVGTPAIPPKRNRDADPLSREHTEGRASLAVKAVVRDLVVPDISVVTVPALYRAALDIVRRNGIQNVLVSSPPHSMQLVGLLLKRKLGSRVNLLADFRDSWNSRRMFSKRNPASRMLNHWCEREVLKHADHILYVSRPMLDKMNLRFFDVSEKATLVMNGFDPAMRPEAAAPRPVGTTLTIGHFGAINAYQRIYRDPEPFFKAISRAGLPIRVVMYGPVDWQPEWTRLLGDRLTANGSVGHHQAVAAMRQTDLLLFLHTQKEDSDEVVSGKLFDYMLARRPILVVGPPEMEATRMVKENNLGYCLDAFDPEGLVSGLRRIHADWAAGGMPDLLEADISRFSRESQYEKVLGLLQ